MRSKLLASIRERGRQAEAVAKEQLKQRLAKEEGVERNPKLHLLFEKAWESGHAYGESEVASHFQDLVDLIR